MYNFSTLFNYKYLANGLLLYDSLSKNLKNFKLYVFTFDNLTYEFLKRAKLKNLILIKLKNFEDKDLQKIKKNRTLTEYFWTCTGSTILYLFNKKKIKECIYVDADTFFFDNPAKILKKLKKKSCLITKHNYSKEYDQTETNGKYCVQFIYFKNNRFGRQILNDWRQECLNWCFNKVEDGKFGDQKYLDKWPKKYGSQVSVSQNVGAGIAPWNSKDYSFFISKNKVKILNKENKKKNDLIFYHFHELKIYTKRIVYIGNYEINKYCYNLVYKDYINKYLKILYELDKSKYFKNLNLFSDIGSGKSMLINLIKLLKNLKNLKFKI